MKDIPLHRLSADDWDELRSPRPAVQGFDHVVERALSRRGFLGSALAFGSAAAVMGTLSGTTSARAQAAGHAGGRFPFTPIPIATDATVHVPEGYEWKVVARWGDPLFSDAGAFDQSVRGTQDDTRAFGENTDGMELFSIDGAEVLAVNHEYANIETNLTPAEAVALEEGGEGGPDGTGPKPKEIATSIEDVRRLQAIQGVSVMEVRGGPGGYEMVVDSPFNRRIDHNTPMELTGPAAGHPLLRTAADPTGTRVLGTLNNCGSGKTPWGTYLTCEENFNGYFGSTDPLIELPAAFVRYGVGVEGRYGYEAFDARFDISKTPNEPNRFGWIVEIDPRDPASTPKKRTGLGRIKHENAAVTLAPDGRVVVYLGDDERGEYLYKFVSSGTYAEGGETEGLLDDGQLYVARFDDDLTGTWVALTPEATGMEAAEILVHTRMAASAVDATTMDRPEWVAVNPVAAEGYCCLTNNSKRGEGAANAGGDAMDVNAPNPRPANEYGQIVRWRPEGDDHAAEGFTWDLYVMAGNPVVADGLYAGSENVNAGNMFNSPDGMGFDSTGLVWIQTDGDDSNEGEFAGMGNNQMLVGDPVSGRIERFLTGPVGSEVTGMAWSADRRTMFVGIQHPAAPFPDGEGMLPRSAVIAVRRADGQTIG